MIHLPVWDTLLLSGFGFLLIALELLLVPPGREGLAGPACSGAADVCPTITNIWNLPTYTTLCAHMSNIEGKEENVLNH